MLETSCLNLDDVKKVSSGTSLTPPCLVERCILHHEPFDLDRVLTLLVRLNSSLGLIASLRTIVFALVLQAQDLDNEEVDSCDFRNQNRFYVLQ